mgnify:CR=1 FL=1
MGTFGRTWSFGETLGILGGHGNRGWNMRLLNAKICENQGGMVETRNS